MDKSQINELVREFLRLYVYEFVRCQVDELTS